VYEYALHVRSLRPGEGCEMLDPAHRLRLAEQQWAAIDQHMFIEIGMPAEFFSNSGVMNVDALLEAGWTINRNGTIFTPPALSDDEGATRI